MIKALRLLLFPFSLLYDLSTSVRNFLFDKKIWPAYRSSLKVVVVGNLSTGGTGKTPFTEWLLRSLNQGNPAVISRGYGRKTKGVRIVDVQSSALEAGDEPLQIKRHFPEVPVIVAEKRTEGLKLLEEKFENLDLAILDDAFQHRHVQADCTILLTTYRQPYYKDFILPAGNLRESAANARRADFIVVTKCPSGLSQKEKEAIVQKLNPLPAQQVFFAYQQNGQPVDDRSRQPVAFDSCKNWLLISGLANNTGLVEYLKTKVSRLEMLAFPDHMNYRLSHVQQILGKAQRAFGSEEFKLITTEKDAVKLSELLSEYPLAVIPVSTAIDNEAVLLKSLKSKIF